MKVLIRSKTEVGHDYVQRHYNRLDIVAWVTSAIATRFNECEAKQFILMHSELDLEIVPIEAHLKTSQEKDAEISRISELLRKSEARYSKAKDMLENCANDPMFGGMKAKTYVKQLKDDEAEELIKNVKEGKKFKGGINNGKPTSRPKVTPKPSKIIKG